MKRGAPDYHCRSIVRFNNFLRICSEEVRLLEKHFGLVSVCWVNSASEQARKFFCRGFLTVENTKCLKELVTGFEEFEIEGVKLGYIPSLVCLRENFTSYYHLLSLILFGCLPYWGWKDWCQFFIVYNIYGYSYNFILRLYFHHEIINDER